MEEETLRLIREYTGMRVLDNATIRPIVVGEDMMEAWFEVELPGLSLRLKLTIPELDSLIEVSQATRAQMRALKSTGDPLMTKERIELDGISVEAPDKLPSLTVIIPSIGYPTLKNTLRSIQLQDLTAEDQILVVGDGVQEESKRLVEQAGPPFSYLETDTNHTWGGAQRNYALDFAKGDYLVWMDEDDIFAAGAFSEIRRIAVHYPKRPLMFQTIYEGSLQTLSYEIYPCKVGGHQFVTPNIPGKVGRWEFNPSGDYGFIESTLDLWGDHSCVAWAKKVIALIRPHNYNLLWFPSPT